MKKIVMVFILVSTILFANSWNKKIDEVKITKQLKIVEQEKIYSGDIVDKEIIQNAPKGKKYVLISIKVEKQDTSKEMFDSYKLKLIVNGKSYEREENDEFLEKFKLNRFPHLRIKLGEHEGVIVYLIDELDNLKEAYLDYQGEKIEPKSLKEN